MDVLLVREDMGRSPIAADLTISYDGEQALKFLPELSFKPDFILLDLKLPTFDGLTAHSAHS